MSADLALGIDVGTTSTKALALDRSGAIVATATAHHGIVESNDRVEADANAWLTSTATAIAQLGLPQERVAAVGMSGNMSAVVMVDAALRPLRPAILLADRRGVAQLERLAPELADAIERSSGNRPRSVFSISSLLWLRDDGAFEGEPMWVPAKDFVRAQLTGSLATEPTDAANSLLVRDGRWSDELIGALGLPRASFPPLGTAGETQGVVSPAAAERFGLPAGVPVATGAGDVAASITGGGGLAAGELAISLGTSATVLAPLPDGAPPAGLTVHPDAEGSRFALGSLLTGGLALNWLRSTVGEAALASAGAAPDDTGGVVFVPHLTGSGSPDFDRHSRGTFFGITPATTGPNLVSALMQAVAFEFAELVASLGRRYDSVVLSGGGARLPAWPRILADVLGMPVRTLHTPDLSAVGAAIYGWRALGHPVRLAETSDAVQPGHDPRWVAARDEYADARRAALQFYNRKVDEA